MKTPRGFFKPLAIGAPAPLRDLPVRVERMIHFVPPHLEKVRAKVPEIAPTVDVVLANLEDAIPADAKDAARAGAVEMGKTVDFKKAGAGFWSRVNCLNSPWHLDDVSALVEGPWDIHYMDQQLALLEAKHGVKKPILLHAILETPEGVNNIEAICGASPRMQGISLGPADLAASRGMKTTRVGGGHPFYKVIEDVREDGGPRAAAQQDIWHYTFAKMVDACAAYGIKAFYGPFGDIADLAGCEQQFRNAFLLGCVGAWTLHPSQIEVAKRVFSPDPGEVKFAARILEAMPDGTGVVMLDGKMQDDATWKQARVMVEAAKQIAAKDPEYKALYGF